MLNSLFVFARKKNYLDVQIIKSINTIYMKHAYNDITLYNQK